MATPDAPYTLLDIGPSQGLPDWARVAGSLYPKVAGVAVKATEGATGAGSTVETFAKNAAGVVAAGLPLSAYHFLSPFSAGRDQAAHFLATVDGCGHTLCPMVDVERSVGAAGRIPTLDTLLDFLDAVSTALDVVPLIYTAAWVATPMGLGAHPELRQYPLWVPSYTQSDPPLCAPWGAWDDPVGNVLAWQYTSKGSVPGIAQSCDVSRFKALPSWVCLSVPAEPAT